MGVYKQAVLARFGNVYDDPLSELKNLKYETSAREYEDAFDKFLSRVEISEIHALSLFMGGLPDEIAMGVRMFKPQTLAYAYCLTNLQEATLEAVKKKNRSGYSGGHSRFASNSCQNSYSKPLLPTPTPVTNTVRPKPNTHVGGNNRRLTQKEYAEKRANNLCFYCDEKYVPGHKCSGQLYSLVVMPEVDVDETECLDDDEQFEDIGVEELQAPQISIHALTGTTNFQTMRVIGKVGKHDINILFECGSTHNFLDKGVARRLGCNVKPTCPLVVTVANGINLITDS